MLFTDPAFLFLALPLIFISYYATSRYVGKQAALAIVFIGSLIIYAPYGLNNVFIFSLSILVNYFTAIFIISSPDSKKRTAIYAFGQAYNLLNLLWFKYAIFQQMVDYLSGKGWVDEALIIPVGISFYTFQQAATLADAYIREPSVLEFFGRLQGLRERIGAFVRYGFFITFFPHMVIGPIAYVREIQPQISHKAFGKLSQANLFVGLMFIGIGLFKKLVIADNLGVASATIFEQSASYAEINPISAWLGVFSYYFQLYFDFSGYSDMALGLSRIFGIRFPINFYSPLKAVGIVDYYKRWHMTLTRAISRFLFTPLTFAATRWAMAKRIGKLNIKIVGTWIPLWLNFIIIGLWHGGAWTFVFFGMWHGTWYIAETEIRGTKRWKRFCKNTSARFRQFAGRAIFIVPMALSFSLFRSPDIATFSHLLGELFILDFSVARSVPNIGSAQWIVLAFVVAMFLPNTVELMRRYRPGIMTFENESYGPELIVRPTFAWTAFWLVIVLISLYYVWRQPPFLYMGF